nr:hypothetical protein [uncultured Noviherbaspirillum sp.]
MTTPHDQQPDYPERDKEAEAAPAAVEPGDAEPAVNGDTPEVSLADEAMNLLSEHKGKLAIGVAATLGMMVYYGWREKRLAKTDPEEYARLQRLKASVRHSDDQPKARPARKTAAARQAEPQADPAADGAPGETETKPDLS